MFKKYISNLRITANYGVIKHIHMTLRNYEALGIIDDFEVISNAESEEESPQPSCPELDPRDGCQVSEDAGKQAEFINCYTDTD